jgi:hypothetical protein
VAGSLAPYRRWLTALAMGENRLLSVLVVIAIRAARPALAHLVI